MKRVVTVTVCLAALLFSLHAAISHAAPPAPTPWKFVVLCDTRSNPCKDEGGGVNGVNADIVKKIAAAVVAERPEVVLVPGDMILGNGYPCTPAVPRPDPAGKQFSYWRQLMQPVYDAGAKVLTVRGNHEMDKDAKSTDHDGCSKKTPTESTLLPAYRAFFNDPTLTASGPANQKGLTYSFPHKNALFVGMDQIVDQFEGDQKWFEQVVASNKLPHLFVFGHYPAFVVRHNDSLACFSDSRDRFWNALGRAGGRLYFCGHDHLYDRSTIPDAQGHLIQQVLVGNGGAPFVYNTGGYPDPRVRREEHIEGAYGYVVVTVNGDEVSGRLKVLDPQGAWRNADAFSYLANRR